MTFARYEEPGGVKMVTHPRTIEGAIRKSWLTIYLMAIVSIIFRRRYEEPGGAKIVTHPRTVEGAIRKEDDRRKKKRAEKAARLEEQEAQRREEVKRLKNLKKAEIDEKLRQVRAGAQSVWLLPDRCPCVPLQMDASWLRVTCRRLHWRGSGAPGAQRACARGLKSAVQVVRPSTTVLRRDS